jgi:hypothetical protein
MRAFAAGCGGRVASVLEPRLLDGDCAFYGVRPPWLQLWEQAKRERRSWWYVDNSYFDVSRERSFRVVKNGIQCDGNNAVWNDEGPKRFKALGIEIRDWQRAGSHVVVCPQSAEFLSVVAGFKGDWTDQAVEVLRQHTDRELRVRRKGTARPLQDDLEGAWALVTHMSAAACEALIAGVPVFCTGQSAAQWMGSSDLSMIETPYYPERRQEWAEVLAANQWSVEEMRSGECWRAFEEQRQRGVRHYGR